jgi:hypothetical protein
MNPLSYLFEGLRSLSDETAMLEACDWDESRLSIVKDIFEKTLYDIFCTNTNKDWEGVLLEVKERLLKSLNEKESEACLHILETNMKNLSKMSQEVEYDN